MTSLTMTYVILRCNRLGVYVRWLDRSGGVSPVPGVPVSSWGLLMRAHVQQSAGGGESCCPVDIAESQETLRCFRALPEHLFETVLQEYIIGGDCGQKCRALGIERTTLWRRLDQAHVALLELFNLAAAGLPLVLARPLVGRPPVRAPVAQSAA